MKVSLGWLNLTHRYGWGGDVQGGGAGQSSDIYRSYTNNRINGWSYDAAGNFTANGSVSYDVTGQPISFPGGMTHSYDGDGLRVKKIENGGATYYLRSTVLGGQVVAEMNGAGGWTRGYVYLGSQLLAVQQAGVYWMHEDPVTKSKRVTNSAGAIVSTIELDPWGAGTSRNLNSAFQPRRFTSYTHDADGGEEAMMRRYGSYWSRFSQPDPYDGSYDATDPQSFNRYAYVQNDPVNFVDPTGLLESWNCYVDGMGMSCGIAGSLINSGMGIVTGFGGFDTIPPGTFRNPRGQLVNGDRIIPNPSDIFGSFFLNMLPQNSLFTAKELVAGARAVIENASGPCAKLMGKDALAKFDKIAGDITFNGDAPIAVNNGGGPQDARLGSVGYIDAVTNGQVVSLNPNGNSFNNVSKGGSGVHILQNLFDKFGVSQRQYAFAVVIHEFLHTTGKFGADYKVRPDGSVEASKSQRNQERVLKDCFPK